MGQRLSDRLLYVIVQIYGVTSISDAKSVDRLGADLIGVVVEEGIATWDAVDESVASKIAAAISQGGVVALSLSTHPQRILATAKLIRPKVLHLARAFQMDLAVLEDLRSSVDAELMLTVPVEGPGSMMMAQRLASVADYLLLDTAHPETGVVGASGLVHDWDLSADIVRAVDVPVMLAGGLGPHNVRAAIERVRPTGVDSETRTSMDTDRRRKDLEKVRDFIEIAKSS
jgi:phosphoribosylanthranilate isomerase